MSSASIATSAPGSPSRKARRRRAGAARAAPSSGPGSDGGHGLRRGHDGNDLELDQVFPARHPLREQRRVVAFHDLKAAGEVLRDPAGDVPEALGCEPAVLAKAAVHRRRVPAAKRSMTMYSMSLAPHAASS